MGVSVLGDHRFLAAVIGIEASLWTAFGLLVAGALALLTVPEIRRLPACPATGRRYGPTPLRARHS